jgi:hypothetical protein
LANTKSSARHILNMNRKEGDKIEFKLGGSQIVATGTIVGIASMPQAVIGTNWIVKLDKPLDGWPFSCVTVFEVHIIR